MVLQSEKRDRFISDRSRFHTLREHAASSYLRRSERAQASFWSDCIESSNNTHAVNHLARPSSHISFRRDG